MVLGSFLGGDNHHAVGGTHTIDSCRRSVFEHAHILDIARVEEIDVIVEHTIHHIQRIGIAEGAITTDTHGRSGTRCATAHHVHTRHLTLHGCHWRSGWHIGDVLGTHHGNGRSQVFRLGRTITDSHHLVEHRRVIFHTDIHGAGGIEHLALHSYIGNLHFRVGRNIVKTKVAINVGDCGHRGTHHSDCGTNHGDANGINHGSLDVL